MPSEAAAKGPLWSVRTPRVMVSAVTPGPVWSWALAPEVGAPAPAAAAVGAALAPPDGWSDLVEQAAAPTSRATRDSVAYRRVRCLGMDGSSFDWVVGLLRERCGGLRRRRCRRGQRRALDAFRRESAPKATADGSQATRFDEQDGDDGGAVAEPCRDPGRHAT